MTHLAKSSLTVETLIWTSSSLESLFLQTLDLDFQVKFEIHWSNTEEEYHIFLLCPGETILLFPLTQKWLKTQNSTLVTHFLEKSVCISEVITPVHTLWTISKSWVDFTKGCNYSSCQSSYDYHSFCYQLTFKWNVQIRYSEEPVLQP